MGGPSSVQLRTQFSGTSYRSASGPRSRLLLRREVRASTENRAHTRVSSPEPLHPIVSGPYPCSDFRLFRPSAVPVTATPTWLFSCTATTMTSPTWIHRSVSDTYCTTTRVGVAPVQQQRFRCVERALRYVAAVYSSATEHSPDLANRLTEDNLPS